MLHVFLINLVKVRKFELTLLVATFFLGRREYIIIHLYPIFSWTNILFKTAEDVFVMLKGSYGSIGMPIGIVPADQRLWPNNPVRNRSREYSLTTK